MTSFHEMALVSGKHKDKLKRLAEPIYLTFGINYYFYLNITHARQCSFIGSDPDLVQHYFNENMHHDNPFFTKTHQVKTGLYLYDSVQQSDFQTAMETLEKKYNAKHCCLITHKDQEGCRIYGFAVPSKQRNCESLMINHPSLIKEFTNFFDAQMEPILKKIHEQPVNMRMQMDDLLKKEAVDVPEIQLSKMDIQNFLGRISNSSIPFYKFTERETEIINLMKYRKDHARNQQRDPAVQSDCGTLHREHKG